jgi:hypothetical protein
MDVIDVRQPGRRRRLIRRPAILATLVACGLAFAGVFASSASASVGECWCTGSGGGQFTGVWGGGFDGSAWGAGGVITQGKLKGTVKGTFGQEGSVFLIYATAYVSGEGTFTGTIGGGQTFTESFWFQGTFNETGYSGNEVLTNAPGTSVPFKIYLTETNGVIYYTVAYECNLPGS